MIERYKMKFKIGVGLLLFGILLANGAVFDIGSWFFLVGGFIGAIGLVMIFLSDDKERK